MPWCCGTASTGAAPAGHGSTPMDSLVVSGTGEPENFGPMLISSQKTALYITVVQQPAECSFIEQLQSNGWQVVTCTASLAESTYQQHRPLIVLFDIRISTVTAISKSLHCLPVADEVLFAALSDRIISEKRTRWLSQCDICHVFLSCSTNITLCELFARMVARLRALPAVFAVLDETEQPIEICDDSFNVQYVNRAYESATGCQRSDILGKKSSETRRKSATCISKRRDSEVDMRKGLISDWRCIQVPGSSHRSQFIYKKRHSSDSTINHNVSLKSVRSQSTFVDAPINEVLFTLRDAMLRVDEDAQMLLREAIRVLSSAELYAPTITRFGNNDRIATGYYDGLIRLHHMPRNRKRSVVDAFKDKRLPSTFESGRRVSVDVRKVLMNDNEWNFDIIQLERVSENHALSQLGIKIFERWKVHEALKCTSDQLARWFTLIEANYHSVNPYHNATHAADVLQATACFLNSPSVAHCVHETHATAVLIAAAVHDLDHPGRGNAFLINTKQPLALLYNDQSVLENHHVALAFQLTLQPSNNINIFAALPREEFTTIRQAAIQMVLATDMSRHFEYLTKFQQTIATTTEESEDSNNDTSMCVCRMMIKCADIGNQTRNWSLCEKWAARIVEEYFDQTIEEYEKNLPLTMALFERSTCNVPLTQCGFIDMFVREAFTLWCEFAKLPALLVQLESNYEKWQLHTASWDPQKNLHLSDEC